MEELDETPFYGGDTRPAMVKYLGLPMTWVGVFFMAYCVGLNFFENWQHKIAWTVLVLAVGVGLWAIYRHDHNALRIFVRYLRSKFKSFDTAHWSGATLEPFPVKWKGGPRGFFDD